ncbi:hypothetical protein EV05_1290 [Prochlorococcus sp. MIT 0601]|nr:hypothetical protein EV05_1290 [Prochlorococcus sp. MIT 0601]
MHKIHIRQNITEISRQRMQGLLSEEYLKVPKNYFQGKKCLDIGCGSNAAGTVNLLNLGAAFVNLVDVDDSFIKPASELLKKYEFSSEKWEPRVANATDLPFLENSFDFILCQGVLHHVGDEKKALSEIHRVLAPKGKFFVAVEGSGGLIGDFVMKTMRDVYRDNEVFKDLIDNNLNLENIRILITEMKNKIPNDQTQSYISSQQFLDSLLDLIDQDLLLTIEDRLLAPSYRQSTESEYLKRLSEAGFSSAYRVSKSPKFSNIRKIVAPFYKDYNSPIAKILYGDGGVMSFVVSKQ